MSNDLGSFAGSSLQDIGPVELENILTDLRAGIGYVGIIVIDAAEQDIIRLPAGKLISQPLIIGNDLVLVQPDGTLVVLLGAAELDMDVVAENATLSTDDLADLALPATMWDSISEIAEKGTIARSSGGPEMLVSVPDPLIGLPFSPLLPPTDYLTPERREEDYSGGGSLISSVIVGPDDIIATETDATVSIRLGDYFSVTSILGAGGVPYEDLSITIFKLPIGTTATLGSFTPDGSGTLTYTFSGSPDDLPNLVLTFPKDFSTDNRSDIVSGDLSGTISVKTDFGDFDTRDFTIRLQVELDVNLDAPAVLRDIEDSYNGDDTGVQLDLGISVAAIDLDGSEDSTRIEIVYTNMPLFAHFNGGSYDVASGVWSGTMAEANALELHLPGDFSGTIDSIIYAISPEGRVEIPQRIEIAPTGDVDFALTELVTAETDAPTIVQPSLSWVISISDTDNTAPHEVLDSVSFTLNGLPAGVKILGGQGATITYDAAAGGSLTFVGTGEQYAQLRLSFPKDYSTESPLQGSTGALTGTISATSTEDPVGGQNLPISLRITPEGDVTIDDTLPDNVPDETDAPTPVKPSDLMLPAPTDMDNSEKIVGALFSVDGLPAGSDIASLGLVLPTGAQTTFVAGVNGSETLYIQLLDAQVGDVLAAYTAIEFALPKDFSTTNRTDLTVGTEMPLTLQLFVGTDEEQNYGIDLANDGQAIATRVIDIDFEADLTLNATPTVTGVEDSLAGDGSGVEVNLGIVIEPVDIDGSEDVIFVEITYTDLPFGTVFLNGTTNLTSNYDRSTGIWSGTEAEAEALSLQLPGDYSGTINASIRAYSPEGEVFQDQTIEISPTPDIDFEITDIQRAETDHSVIVRPAADWKVEISDNDLNLPLERLETVTLTLNDLPPGVVINSPLGGSITYDAVNGGQLVFTGTGDEYSALLLQFPTDFSTENRTPPQIDGPITGTLAATSTEGAATSPVPLNLVITPEGDVDIDDSLPDNVADETDSVTPVTPSDLLEPMATDADGSEAINRLVLVIEGLPVGSDLATLNFSGIPAGAVVATAIGVGDSVTITITLESPAVPDPVAAYDAINFELPIDFSTANRVDITPVSGTTTLPIILRLTAETDEDQDLANDSVADGQKTVSRQIDIDFELDAEIAAPAQVTGVEDSNGPTLGVTVDLEIDVQPVDIDGSEDSTTVAIKYTNIPTGVSFNGGSYDPQTATWTGSMAEANALELTLPQDYSGTIISVITAISPEGRVSTPQEIVISGTGDIDITAPDIVVDETDAAVDIRPSDQWVVTVTDTSGNPPEQIDTVTLTLNDLPPDVLVANPVGGSVTYDPVAGGSFTFVGSLDQYNALELLFPRDYSTTNPQTGVTGFIEGTISANSTEQPTPDTAPVRLQIEEEGDIEAILRPDIIPDETDLETPISPSDLLTVVATDRDGSETVQELTLVVEGLPSIFVGGANDPYTDLQVSGVPTGNVSFVTAVDGSLTMTITLDIAQFPDVVATYEGIGFVLPQDFSTTNRVDISAGSSLPMTFRLEAITDEDRDPTSDLANDGQVTAEQVVVIDYEHDINLSAEPIVTVLEDGGPNMSGGTTITATDLDIDISVDDIDGSETSGNYDPASGNNVSIFYVNLPAGTTFSSLGGDVSTQYDPATRTWTGSIDQANDLSLLTPPNINGTIGSIITVETPEGATATPQTIIIQAQPDAQLDGVVITQETDADLPVRLSDYISILDPDPGETVTSGTITIPNLPPGTTANGGTLVSDPANPGMLQLEYTYPGGTGTFPVDLEVTFPRDFSTENPGQTIVGEVHLEIDDNGTPEVFDATFPITIEVEGDVTVAFANGTDGNIDLAETDDPVDFKPYDHLIPMATDVDGSEQITEVSVVFNDLPAGTEFSTDDGVTFQAIPNARLDFIGTFAEYTQLVVRLPEDYSTTSPPTTLFGLVGALTDEGGVAFERMDINVAFEQDLVVTGDALTIAENDQPGDTDEDNTPEGPQAGYELFRISDVVDAAADSSAGPDGDDDGSEVINSITLTIDNLPDGSMISYDGGATFATLPNGPYTETFTTIADYRNVVFTLPDDFSTRDGDITGSAQFQTNEGGDETRDFTVTVTPEADVDIITNDITEIEDLVSATPIPLNLDAIVTDIDGSESIVDPIVVTFTDLPTNGDTVLDDGTGVPVTLSGPTATVNLTLAQLQALTVTSLPQHFSGIIQIEVEVQTDEGGATTDTMALNITPVAEPVIDLSVEVSAPDVTQDSSGAYVVKEDTQFTLQIDASTPDQDGSEELTQIVIENIPTGWLPNGAVPTSLFTGDVSKISGATMSGTTLTIDLNSGNTSFNAGVLTTPNLNDDSDVIDLVGDDLIATVTSVDTAAGLPSDTQTATDTVDVDVDAVVDPIDITANNRAVNENTSGNRNVRLNMTGFALQDTDGSEVVTALRFDLSVVTASDNFSVSDLDVYVASGNAAYAHITLVPDPSDPLSAELIVEPAGGATADQFATALENLVLRFPQHFSGVTTLDGELSWEEANTTGNEYDLADNTATEPVALTVTVRPVAEAELESSVFVLRTEEVPTGEPLRVDAQVKDGSVSGAEILTLLESTDDGSSPAGTTTKADGQVNLFVGIAGSTPDLDGSEELDTIVISNIPTAWIAQSGGVVDMTSFYDITGQGSLSQAERNKIDTATYDSATGELTITFVPDVTEFDGALLLQPSLYEDYDIDRNNSDPYTSVGDFFDADLNIKVTTTDTNTVQTRTRDADATFDVDVNPVNNFANVVSLPVGNEAVIDAAGGVANFSLLTDFKDLDGSEQITAVVLRNVPSNITIYVDDTSNPGGPKVPALITVLNSPPGFNTWSLEANYNNGVIQWDDIRVEGIPLHWAGEIIESIDVVTTEDDGNTRTTNSQVPVHIEPVADGGDPSEKTSTDEDTAVRVVIDGNIIDNSTNSPESPEAILDTIEVLHISTDSFGRVPEFYLGNPAAGGTKIDSSAGTFLLTPAQAQNLWVLPGQDSNEQITFEIEVVYYETIKPSEFTTGRGTVTIDVSGVADTPIVTVQSADPNDSSNPTIPQSSVDAIYDASVHYDQLYGYAGYDSNSFTLDQKLTEMALELGYDDPSVFGSVFDAAAPLAGTMSEIQNTAGNFDGSETIYYMITGVDPSTSFVGATPIDASGETYIVTASQLASMEFVPNQVNEVTYYDMQFHAIVIEDDQVIGSLPGPDVAANLAYINSLAGGAVETRDFTVVVLPDPGSPGLPCTPNQELPLPTLTLIGSGDEDTAIPLQIKLTPNPPFYDSIADLINLPNGVDGSFTLALDLPAGATLSSTPSGAVLLDPATGQWIVDFAKLGVDPNDPTQTEGSILFTPPAHQSSPDNPFAASETLGPNDPYDGLNTLDFSTRLLNVTCGTVDDGSGQFSLVINPVVDGPSISFRGIKRFDEDTDYQLNLDITDPDGGERLTGDVEISFTGSGPGWTGDVDLYDKNGILITPSSQGVYSVPIDQIDGLYIRPPQHFGGGSINITVSATAEDIDGSTKTNSATQKVNVIAVADVPTFTFDTSVLDADTGLPYLDVTSGTPVVTLIEDIAFTAYDVVQPDTPDKDGSETTSIVIDLTNAPGLTISGPSGGGFIDNGDGTYTVSEGAYQSVTFSLDPEHARTPDSINGIAAEFPVTVTVQTLELSNADTQTASQDFIVRVRPDADVPTLTASLDPATGTEDQAAAYSISLSATTPDPHEEMEFQVTLPTDTSGNPIGTILVGGVAQTPVGGVVTIAGTSSGGGFQPVGAVTFVPPADFGGDVSFSVVAVTIDSTDPSAIFEDRQPSPAQQLDLSIAPAPDLVLTVDVPAVTLQETDAAVLYSPAADFTIDVTDVDGSEQIDSVTYTLTGVPDGTTWSAGALSGTASGGTLTFTGSQADFNALEISFPADFATNGTSVDGSITVTTNEGGNATDTFTIDVDGELDVSVTNITPISVADTGAPVVVDFGIDAQILPDETSNPWETLEEVVISFNTALPAGTTASAGTIDFGANTLTVTRGATDTATFAATIAALTLTMPAGSAVALDGDIVVTTNHGTAAAQSFQVDLNQAPVPSTSPTIEISGTTSYTIAAADLLQGVTDPEGNNMEIANPATADPDVTVTLLANGDVEVTVPDAYAGTPTLTYDIVDDGVPPASASATATLEINTLQMVATGATHQGNPLLSDVTGAAGGNDIALGTANADSVVVDATSPYDEIEGFSMLGGDDLVDLSMASRGFSVDGGAGADNIIGSAFDDVLIGGTEADTLFGGDGRDLFVLDDLSASDVIEDYESPSAAPGDNDRVDLTALVQSDDVTAHVSYNSSNGALIVDGNQVATLGIAGGGFSDQVAIIFEDAAGQQQSAVL
ncbi:cadherin-like domain-containing protein [Falsihalocynthiibacter sp. SS001]|uniref:cadherin-like domain-containing protein n=1 Tax=Falsihalocynthiibacter sp. SS001 TaxID=3349698 RepID=UPI0036D28C5B